MSSNDGPTLERRRSKRLSESEAAGPSLKRQTTEEQLSSFGSLSTEEPKPSKRVSQDSSSTSVTA